MMYYWDKKQCKCMVIVREFPFKICALFGLVSYVMIPDSTTRDGSIKRVFGSILFFYFPPPQKIPPFPSSACTWGIFLLTTQLRMRQKGKISMAIRRNPKENDGNDGRGVGGVDLVSHVLLDFVGVLAPKSAVARRYVNIIYHYNMYMYIYISIICICNIYI